MKPAKGLVAGTGMLITLGIALVIAPVALSAGDPATYGAATLGSAASASSAFDYHAPPPGFDFTHATKRQLVKYGFPAYPGSTPPPAEAAAIADARVFVAPVADTSDPLGNGTAAGKNTPMNQPNWAGKVLTPGHYSAAESDWVEPKTTQISPDIDSESVIWDGIGDGNGTELVQAGTRQKVINLFPPEYTVHYAFWWETYPTNSLQPLSSPAVHAGDKVYVSVSYHGSKATFTFENLTTGALTSFAKTFPHKTGNIAECIVEDPGNGSRPGPYFELADFGTVTFTSCYGFSTNHGQFEGIGALNHTTDTMVQGGTTYATVSATSGDHNSTFHVTRKHVP